jgi:hypothetical protein
LAFFGARLKTDDDALIPAWADGCEVANLDHFFTKHQANVVALCDAADNLRTVPIISHEE